MSLQALKIFQNEEKQSDLEEKSSFMNSIVDQTLNRISHFNKNIYSSDASQFTGNVPSTSEQVNATSSFEGPKVFSPVIFKPTSIAFPKSIPLQQWEGIVISVGTEYFWARLRDLTNQSNPEEEAEILISEISEEDRKILKPGALFYWSIFYHEKERGPRRRVSDIRMARIPVWREKDVQNAKQEIDEIFSDLGWE